MEKNIKDIIIFLSILIISLISIYYLPSAITRLVFLVLFFLAWMSKRDYIWFAIVFVFFSNPAGLFPAGSFEQTYRLPLYNFAPGLSFNTTDIFVILLFIKAIIKGKRKPFFFDKIFIPFILIFIISIVFTFYYSNDLDGFANQMRKYFTYSALFSFTYLVNNTKEIFRFFIFMLIIIPVIFIDQILTYYDLSILFLLGKKEIFIEYMIENTAEKRLIILGVLNVFWVYIFSIVYLYSKKNNIKLFLILIMILCLISFLISATRFWIFTGFVLLLLSLLLGRSSLKNIFQISLTCVIFYIVLSSINYNYSQITAAWTRFLPSISKVATGRMEQVHTVNTRIRAVKKIKIELKENPIFGFGFSKLNKSNNDLGFWNTLIVFGFFGLILFFGFFFYIFYGLYSIWIKQNKGSPYFYPLRMLAVGFVGIFIGFLTTWDFFHTGPSRIFFISIYLAVINIYVQEAKNKLTKNYILNKT
ncbi:MAG: hypothetical protein KAT68_06285 [Bacteroidales bacterium]|nr:hypothetical protein [Bacteroidales bacterium]